MRFELTPRLLVLLTAGIVVTGLATFVVWAATGDERLLRAFFDYPGEAFLAAAPFIGLRFSISVFRRYGPGGPLRAGWFLITAAFACQATGGLAAHVLGVRSFWNPLFWTGSPDLARVAWLRGIGHTIAGPFWIVLLVSALFVAWRAYKIAGVRQTLKPIDWAAAVLCGAYAVVQLRQVAGAIQSGKQMTVQGTLDLVNDPLLCVLAVLSILIQRSVRGMGTGLLARCWGSFVAGILLTTAGNIGTWATNYGYITRPYAGLVWYIWFPAAAAFVLGPLYQYIAVEHATHPGRLPLDAALWMWPQAGLASRQYGK
jgi:hypothetical protein